MDFGKWKFWQTEKREDVQPAKSNQEIALDLLIQIKHKAPENQRDIVAKLFSQVFSDHHIHRNPVSKNVFLNEDGN
jgi:hypothetical protein